MKSLICLALAALVASPALAAEPMSAARAAAIHRCSVAAYNNTYKEYNSATGKIDYYRACMTAAGEVE